MNGMLIKDRMGGLVVVDLTSISTVAVIITVSLSAVTFVVVIVIFSLIINSRLNVKFKILCE